MKKQIKLEEIVGYLPYGLKARIEDFKCDYVGREFDLIIGFHQWDSSGKLWSALTDGGAKPDISKIKPILRNLSDLTKEIEVNREKFVPMVELAKIANLDTTEYKLAANENTYGIACNIENDVDNDKWEVLGFDTTNGFGHHYRPSKNWTIVMNQFELWSKLYEWHFDIHNLIERGLAIDINTLKK